MRRLMGSLLVLCIHTRAYNPMTTEKNLSVHVYNSVLCTGVLVSIIPLQLYYCTRYVIQYNTVTTLASSSTVLDIVLGRSTFVL
jgi:hypothetical protein